jgi:hypothetical protein
MDIQLLAAALNGPGAEVPFYAPARAFAANGHLPAEPVPHHAANGEAANGHPLNANGHAANGTGASRSVHGANGTIHPPSPRRRSVAPVVPEVRALPAE